MLIICLKNICINKSVLVANPCPTMKISSFVPLVSELILSSADVPFSPSCMARDSFVRFGNLLPVSAFHIDQPKNKDCKSRRETWFLRFLSTHLNNGLIDFPQFIQPRGPPPKPGSLSGTCSVRVRPPSSDRASSVRPSVQGMRLNLV